MSLKVALCVFAILSQTIAGPSWQIPPPSCSYDCDINVPVYNCEGIAISEIDSYKPSIKPTFSSSKHYQSSYKPTLTYSDVESFKPISISSPISDNGGALIVTSVSPIAPFGIGVASDVNLVGELVLSGALPYLSAVAFEGQFDTSGAAPVEYGCGDCVAITEQIGGNSGYSSISGCAKY